ncbi:hypothetical protein EUTSA_v10011074mg [Eutrema salsugineum]|uniref:DUF1985 domain-containing protein n=1 Tax=Eutrema salsugineum TaxID=72664 RepID=V4M0Y2_EUTSA|nr:hypothetical protein EUTSA_v10011074mg [Eutrema salsugineum]
MATPEFSSRIFAAGDEPSSERVNSYHKAKTISNILDVIDEEERSYLRNSPFRKLIATAKKLAFSRSFDHYIITRLLKVNKKHEIWILFACRPIRVSLREFAIVTGLPCGRYPKRSKKKKGIRVDLATKMLKKRTIVDRTTRLKYTCLAITGGVLCPTNHRYKIMYDHIELIRDLGEFFLYAWGRLGFEMLMENVPEDFSYNGFKDQLATIETSLAEELLKIGVLDKVVDGVHDKNPAGGECNSHETAVVGSKYTLQAGSKVGDSNDVLEKNQEASDADGGDDFIDDVANANVGLRREKKPRIQNTAFTGYQVDTKMLASTMETHPFLCTPGQQRLYFEKFARLHLTVKAQCFFINATLSQGNQPWGWIVC